MSSKHTYKVLKPITLNEVVRAGINMHPQVVLEWLEDLVVDSDEIIDWCSDKEFRAFAWRTGLTKQLADKGFIVINPAPEVKLPEPTYRFGNWFELKAYNQTFYVQLVQIDSDLVILVNPESGNRWTAPCSVKDASKITEAEMQQIAGGNTKFRKISNPQIFKPV